MEYIDDSLFYSSLSHFQRLYAKGLSMRLAPYGVKPGYLSILHYLWQKDGITQKDLMRLLHIEQATVSRTLVRMERDELVLRKKNPNDRRNSLLHLTDKGIKLKTAVESAIDDLRATANKGLTVNDRRYFKRIMHQMTHSLASDLKDPMLVLVDVVQED